METEDAFGETTLVVDPARIVDACLHLRDEFGFNMLADLTAADYLGWGGRGVAGSSRKGVNPMIDPILWDKLQTAKLLGVSVRSLDRLLRDSANPLPHVPVGRLIKFRPADVMAWIDGKVTTEAPRLAEKSKGGDE